MTSMEDLFEALSSVDDSVALRRLPDSMIELVLPFVCRTMINSSSPSCVEHLASRTSLSRDVNRMLPFLNFDISHIQDSLQEQMRTISKLPSADISQALVTNRLTLLSTFESSSVADKLSTIHREFYLLVRLLSEERVALPLQYACEFLEFETIRFDTFLGLFIILSDAPCVLKIEDVVEVLLKLKLCHSLNLFVKLVLNLPASFTDILRSVLRVKLDLQQENLRTTFIMKMVEMDTSSCDYVIHLLVKKQIYPDLLLELMCRKSEKSTYREPVLHFLLEVFASEDKSLKKWMLTYLRELWKSRSTFSSQLKNTLQRLQIACDEQNTNYNVIVLSISYIKLCCCLRVFANWRFEDDNKILITLMTQNFENSDLNSRYVKSVLAALVVVPQLILNSEHEKQMLDWLKWLKACCIKQGSSYIETLVLMVIFFLQTMPDDLNLLVNSILQIEMPVKFENLNRIKTFFTKLLFSECEVAQICARMNTTNALSANSKSMLPIDCVMNLVNQNSFEKNQISISNWVFDQIKHCRLPIHDGVVGLVEKFLSCVIQPTSINIFREKRFDENDLLEVFQYPFSSVHNGDSLLPQLLFLYYLLHYKETVIIRTKTQPHPERVQNVQYSMKLLEQVPIRFLLRQAEKVQQDLGSLYPKLLKSASSQYPQLFQFHGAVTLRWFFQTEYVDEESFHVEKDAIPSSAKLLFHFEDPVRNCKDCLKSLKALTKINESEMLSFVDVFVSILPNLLNEGVPLKILTLSLEVWNRFNSAVPRLLWVKTVNALQSSPEFKIKYTTADLTIDPLSVLKCDERIMRNPVLLVIILRVFAAFLIGSRVYLSDQISLNPARIAAPVNDNEKDELRAALITAQESTAIQILLEACLPLEVESSTWHLSNLREVQGIICSHIHQMYLEDPNIIKLVHFQGYDHKLIEIACNGIPSMHICFDFIPELLNQPDSRQQIFAVDLVSHLVVQYTIPKAYSIARLAVNVTSAVIEVLPKDKLYNYMQLVLPALERISKAFPPLCKDTVGILYLLAEFCWSSSNKHDAAALSEFDQDWPTIETEVDEVGSSILMLYQLTRETYINTIKSTANRLL